MGIVAFAVTAILGLLPSGLSTLRESMGKTVETQIVRSEVAQALSGSFTNLASTNYYDSEGENTNSANAFYTVSVSTTNPVFPGCSNAPTLTNALTRLLIGVVAVNAPRITNVYSLPIANQGK